MPFNPQYDFTDFLVKDKKLRPHPCPRIQSHEQRGLMAEGLELNFSPKNNNIQN